jgi:hypothetical protein
MNIALLELDANGLLAAATEAERASRLAEVHRLELLSTWAATHSTDPTEGPDGRIARRVGNVLRQVGGEGTPGDSVSCPRLPGRPPRRTTRRRPHPAGAEGRAARPPARGSLGGVGGVARVEGLGPVTLSRLADLLRGSVVKVQRVKDLSDRVRYTAYEHPESLRDQVHLVTCGDYWPWATSTSRSVDLDHPLAYDHGDEGRDPPPDQTGSHNSGPLGRRHHRWKTHAGYTSRQCGEGRYVWLTPHGLGFLVHHTGTHRIHPEKARMILEAPAGVDIYPS